MGSMRKIFIGLGMAVMIGALVLELMVITPTRNYMNWDGVQSEKPITEHPDSITKWKQVGEIRISLNPKTNSWGITGKTPEKERWLIVPLTSELPIRSTETANPSLIAGKKYKIKPVAWKLFFLVAGDKVTVTSPFGEVRNDPNDLDQTLIASNWGRPVFRLSSASWGETLPENCRMRSGSLGTCEWEFLVVNPNDQIELSLSLPLAGSDIQKLFNSVAMDAVFRVFEEN